MTWPPLPRSTSDADDLPPGREATPRVEAGSFADILTFRSMITPLLIQFVFWAGTIICAVVGGRLIAESFQDSTPHDSGEVRPRSAGRDGSASRDKQDGAANTFAAGFGLMFGGPLALRIWCELTIVLFTIQRELRIANDRR